MRKSVLLKLEAQSSTSPSSFALCPLYTSGREVKVAGEDQSGKVTSKSRVSNLTHGVKFVFPGKKKPQPPVSLVLCNLQLAVLQSSTRVVCSLTLCLPYFSFQTVFSPLLLIPPKKKKKKMPVSSCKLVAELLADRFAHSFSRSLISHLGKAN